MVAPRHRLTVDLAELRAPWVKFCASSGESAAAGMRRAVANVLREATALPTTAVQAEEGGIAPVTVSLARNEDTQRVRCEVQLTVDEAAMIDRRAASGGDKRQRWIIACLRHQLFREVQFTTNELDALNRSSTQLLAVGRNLNQLVKALNTRSPVSITAQTSGVQNVRGALREHLENVNRLVLVSERRWLPSTKKVVAAATHE